VTPLSAWALEKAREIVRAFHYSSPDVTGNTSLYRDDAERLIALALDAERAAVWEEAATLWPEDDSLWVGREIVKTLRANAAVRREEGTG